MKPSTNSSKKIGYWLIITALLLIISASRLLRLGEIQMNPDEIWSVWQTFGTPSQIIQWTPYDWPPLYYLLIGTWWRITSLIPESLRLLSMLIFLIGTTFTYKIGRRLGGLHTGICVALIYAALGYNILLSIEVRGYALLLGLMPLAFWLMLRYFERENRLYGVLLALSLVAMFYTSYTSSLAIIMLGIYSSIVYGRKIIRWWLPGVITVVLILPELLQIRSTVTGRVAATSQLNTAPLLPALYNLFEGWTGSLFIIWIILFLVATGLLIYHNRSSRKAWALFVWIVLIPLLLYFLNPFLGFFSARYAWWGMLGLALWVGWGLAYLPRFPRLGAYGALVILMFLPLPMDRYSIWGNGVSPLGRNFKWLTTQMQWGDTLIADPNNGCGKAEEWDYYTRVYFPSGLYFSSDPIHNRRVWYILEGGRQNLELEQLISHNRVRRNQFGPSRCVFVLYELPPFPDGIRFDNGLRFHGADIISAEGDLRPPLPAVHEGEVIRLQLWWSVDQPLDQQYTIGTYIGREGGLGITETPPQLIDSVDTALPMNQWQPGEYYIEEREIQLRASMSSNQYRIQLAVIDPLTGDRIGGEGLSQANLLRINEITVQSY